MGVDAEIQKLRDIKTEADRLFLQKVMTTLRSDFAFSEYAKRIRSKHPLLKDLADECDKLASVCARGDHAA